MSREKLNLYKTAYSKTYESYVEIISVRDDELGEPIITARIPGRENYVLFRVCELDKFCL